MFNYNNELPELYNEQKLLNIKNFSKQFTGRSVTCTLYSLNKNTTQTVHGQLHKSEAKRFTKVERYPLFNVQQHDLNVTYDFENSGFRTEEVNTEAIIIPEIYNIVAGDIIIFKYFDKEDTVYEVITDEVDVNIDENNNYKSIKMKIIDYKVNFLELHTEVSLRYNFETNILETMNFIEKINMIVKKINKDLSILSLLKEQIENKFKQGVGLNSNLDYNLFNIIDNPYEFYDNTLYYINTPTYLKKEIEKNNLKRYIINLRDDSYTKILNTIDTFTNIYQEILLLEELKRNGCNIILTIENYKIIMEVKHV